MQTLSPQHWSRLLVMVLMAWVVVWGVSLTTAAPQDPAPSIEVPLVWQGELYLCSPVDSESAVHTDAEASNVEAGGAWQK